MPAATPKLFEGLTDEQLKEFEDEGCLALKNFLSEEEVNVLLQEAKRLLSEIDLDNHAMTKFVTTEDSENHVGDEYFLNSSDKICSFFDTDAFNDEGKLIKPKEKSVNKIGHNLHSLNDEYYKISFDERIQDISKKLGFKDPRILQSMLIFKQPEIGGSVPSHQDSTFLYTEPLSAIGFWFALEDCTKENGCLSYYPGSHKTFPVTKRMIKDFDKKSGTKFVNTKVGESLYKTNVDELNDAKARNDDKNFKLVEIPRGSLVLIHGSVLHKSERNSSQKSRYAYTFHVIEGENDYDNLNWLQVPPCREGSTNFSSLITGNKVGIY
ncbi:hypothetical protein PACTADRAFT_33987 [Pachysolen tannophilus NRRL Y-2460]|uniref:Fe2OG dioxygenase domain-containing protein n=1 Tax=Pachysolen tannophilus NRRL Y-2460 TaxID=669874 RepID=A0A1E4TUM8_PACTA|nr:hypothetical protein PACTADRAFT_33987 [Pachysolen tannophilus NRRL Y-2460]